VNSLAKAGDLSLFSRITGVGDDQQRELGPMNEEEWVKLLTPRMRAVMRRAWVNARQRGHGFIGTEHVLAALTADDGGIARQALIDLGVAGEVRRHITATMDSEEYRHGLRPDSR